MEAVPAKYAAICGFQPRNNGPAGWIPEIKISGSFSGLSSPDNDAARYDSTPT